MSSDDDDDSFMSSDNDNMIGPSSSKYQTQEYVASINANSIIKTSAQDRAQKQKEPDYGNLLSDGFDYFTFNSAETDEHNIKRAISQNVKKELQGSPKNRDDDETTLAEASPGAHPGLVPCSCRQPLLAQQRYRSASASDLEAGDEQHYHIKVRRVKKEEDPGDACPMLAVAIIAVLIVGIFLVVVASHLQPY